VDGDASLGVGLLLEGIVIEERDEAGGQPGPAVEPQPLRPRQRHPAKQAEDTPFGLFVAENVQLVSCQKHWRSPTKAGEAYRRRARVAALATL